ATAWGDEPRLGNGSVVWSPDGQVVAGMSNSVHRERGIWVFTMEGRTPPRQIVKLGASQRGRGIAWLPDKSKLILGLSERTSDIVLFDQASLSVDGLSLLPDYCRRDSLVEGLRRRRGVRLQRHQPAGAAARARG